jgi:hypothetical protein
VARPQLLQGGCRVLTGIPCVAIRGPGLYETRLHTEAICGGNLHETALVQSLADVSQPAAAAASDSDSDSDSDADPDYAAGEPEPEPEPESGVASPSQSPSVTAAMLHGARRWVERPPDMAKSDSCYSLAEYVFGDDGRYVNLSPWY